MNEGPPYFCPCGVLVDHEHDDCPDCLAQQGDDAQVVVAGPMASFEEVFGSRMGDSSGPD